MMIRDEYKEVGVPMLPVIEGDAETARQIWIYTLLMIPATLLLVYPLHLAGAVYAGTAIFLGAVFAQKAWLLLQTPEDKIVARSLFKYSILYLMLLCAGIVVDSLPVTHNFTTAVVQNVQTLISAVVM
jgi:protoheme IX farnesyltransferase